MANGTSRVALSKIALRNQKGTEEMNAEMERLSQKEGQKIPLKNPSEHNHSK